MEKKSKKKPPSKKQYKPKPKSRKQWQREADKEKFWRKMLREWEVSGLTIRAFARKKGLQEGSFYAWRREIRIRNREAAVANTSTLDESQPVRAHDSAGRFLPIRFLEHSENRLETKEFQAPKLVFKDPESRRHFWKVKVEEYWSSGLTAREYCSKHNLKLTTFSDWRRRFNNKGRWKSVEMERAVVASEVIDELSDLPSFLTVNLVDHSSEPIADVGRLDAQARKIELRTPAGFVIQFAAEFDTNQLLPLLRELSRFEC
jgi:hypothetical protein